jgi:iron only hydrogenase large subunit-like protein
LSELNRREESVAVSAPSAPSDFLIARDAAHCRACWSCVRHCPAQAIRVVHGRPEIIESRCVKCGVCVVECGNDGYVPRDDLSAVRALLASDARVVAVLASEYLAALHPMDAAEVENALEQAGFDSVETTVLGEELVAAAYEHTGSQTLGAPPRLRSTCPVVVSWVERYHPQLTSALVGIVPPYIAHARLVKATSPPNTAVVYMSPCWAVR